MKKIFKIDTALYILGVLTLATGIGLHVAGHGSDHHLWVVWAYAHSIVAAAFTCMMVQHMLTHKTWIKGLGNGMLRRKRRVTILLAVAALAVVASGIALIAIHGANSHTGMLHYRLGLLFALLAIGHSARRLNILLKAFNA